MSITTNSTCTSTENPSVNLTDPGIPQITSIVEHDPVTCGGEDGSIEVNVNANGATHISYGADDGSGVAWTSNNPIP